MGSKSFGLSFGIVCIFGKCLGLIEREVILGEHVIFGIRCLGNLCIFVELICHLGFVEIPYEGIAGVHILEFDRVGSPVVGGIVGHEGDIFVLGHFDLVLLAVSTDQQAVVDLIECLAVDVRIGDAKCIEDIVDARVVISGENRISGENILFAGIVELLRIAVEGSRSLGSLEQLVDPTWLLRTIQEANCLKTS